MLALVSACRQPTAVPFGTPSATQIIVADDSGAEGFAYAVPTTPATAPYNYPPDVTFRPGRNNAQPTGVAVGSTNGRIYIANIVAGPPIQDRVSVYALAGSPSLTPSPDLDISGSTSSTGGVGIGNGRIYKANILTGGLPHNILVFDYSNGRYQAVIMGTATNIVEILALAAVPASPTLDRVYVANADNGASNILAFELNSTSVVMPTAPIATVSDNATLYNPVAIAGDAHGYVYVVNAPSHGKPGSVTVLDASGANKLTPVAFLQDNRLDSPTAIAADGTGGIYVTDKGKPAQILIYSLDTKAGKIYSFASIAGPATMLSDPVGIAVTR
jgi:hypothetical protein